MCLVAYAWDSRTMTVDYFDKIYQIVKKYDKDIWLHADACHWFSLWFSRKLKHKIKWIELFDSISLDPHKVMAVPYTISALLVRKPESFRTITSLSDLIMKEEYAFWQITPFIWSKQWSSLKLWFMMKNFWKKWLEKLIDHRFKMANYLADSIKNRNDFILINDVEINSVLFMYLWDSKLSLNNINILNKEIHKNILSDWKYHLHQFSIPDTWHFKKWELLYPLRFMTGNMNLNVEDIDNMLEYVSELASKIKKWKK